jgi:hypothetical protein
MIDATAAGTRCQATREIRTHAGLIKRSAEGVILYDIDSLGRRLIYVQWDNGLAGYVYPVEIEAVAIIAKPLARAS